VEKVVTACGIMRTRGTTAGLKKDEAEEEVLRSDLVS